MFIYIEFEDEQEFHSPCPWEDSSEDLAEVLAKALLPERGEVNPIGKGGWDRWCPCRHQRESPWRKRGSPPGQFSPFCEPSQKRSEGERQMGTGQVEVRSSGCFPFLQL